MASFSALEKIQWKHYDKWYLPFTWENRKFRLENHMVCINPSGKTWEALENSMGCDLRRCNFSASFSLFS